ncbi:MAG: zinc-binding alcohol dehydrogenase family protein [Proteobacteria bacterium]|nr:zinc-binding alcohol dehydrogenase family protein [Pseudomonadota bacterium]
MRDPLERSIIPPIMRAIVVDEPGDPDVLIVREWPRPAIKSGWITIAVKAFGLNRSEMFTRQGHSPSVRFPRVLGIECVGVVEESMDSNFSPEQKVAAMMGGMGRDFDGGYAEYTCVPARNAFVIDSDLDWSVLGAVPEMFQTAYGSLTAGLEVARGQTLLIRGGTSSVGMTAAQLAKTIGLTVLATTRNAEKCHALLENGADHAIIDDGDIAEQVRAVVPGGVDRVLELVGTHTLRDSLRAAAPGAIVCMSGILGNQWTLDGFAPMTDIPSTVKLTSYSGEASNVSAQLLQEFIDGIAAGHTAIRIDRVFQFDDIVAAHRYMECNQACGKLVVVV